LWWGQRIPAWYAPDGSFAVADTKEEAFQILQQENTQHSSLSIDDIKQDEDCLDTWFSSWLWPMEVFKGISNPGNKDAEYYYPTTTLVTGQDIIFFWVARMIMAGFEFKKEQPFKDVYFTGMVRDKQGRKMSKQLGNSPDLLNLIDQYGADAVRFGILIASPAGNDLLWEESSNEQGRNFNNKLWNALKLVKMWEARTKDNGPQITAESNFAVDWFDNRLNEAKAEIDQLFKEFRLSEALKTIYSLIWDDFCSWYLEWVKPGFEQPIDAAVYNKTVDFFEELMQLLHPFMPFISEEIYHALKVRAAGDDITIKQLSPAASADKEVLQLALQLKEVITALRDIRVKNQIKPKEAIKLSIETDQQQSYKLIETILAKQLNAESISYVSASVAGTISAVIQKDKFYIATEQAIDTSSQKEQMLKDLEYLKGFLLSVEKKLGNERFVQNAKPEVVDIEKKKKADAEAKIKAIEESLASL
jgi:valyl-tRNA synthetase